MKTTILILVAMLLGALPCAAGTNLTVRVIGDEHGDSHWQVFSHGTNGVLKIHHRGKGTWITSEAGGYSITHTDENGDGIAESIMISQFGGNILEVLKRSADGQYQPSLQSDLDEMNAIARKIEAGIPRRKDETAPNHTSEGIRRPADGSTKPSM